MSIQKTFSDYRDDVLNEISNQIKNELGDDFPPEKELVYLAKTAFSNAIHIAYISREYANESDNEQLAKSLAGDGSDIIEYFQSFIKMGVCLDRIDQWKEIIKSWPIKDTPIRFYGKGGNSNLRIALDFSQWVRDLCLTDGAGQMGMDKSIVLTPQYNKTAEDFYKLAMRKLNENLPSELEWTKSRIGQESGCVQGSIETELKAYQTGKPEPQAGAGEDDQQIAASKEALALATLKDHPDWSDTKIAKTIGVSRTTLYDWPDFKKAKEILKQGKTALPRGNKNKETGIEAWDEENDKADTFADT